MSFPTVWISTSSAEQAAAGNFFLIDRSQYSVFSAAFRINTSFYDRIHTSPNLCRHKKIQWRLAICKVFSGFPLQLKTTKYTVVLYLITIVTAMF